MTILGVESGFKMLGIASTQSISHLGSRVASFSYTAGQTGAATIVEDKVDYASFGASTETENYSYTGKDKDVFYVKDANGVVKFSYHLVYFNARWYDPDLGRFISEDPIKDGPNWYIYCGNDPVNRVDWAGLENYVFYDPDNFSNYAYAVVNNLAYQKEKTILKPIKTEQQFVTEWNGMQDPTDVVLIFHGHQNTIDIDYRTEEYLTALPTGKTPKGADATYIGDLERKSLESIWLLSCQSDNVDEPLSPAKVFAKTQNVKTVKGWDGPLSFSIDMWKGMTLVPRLPFWPSEYEEYRDKYKHEPSGATRVECRR
jgi:RHS repeat-associated protein